MIGNAGNDTMSGWEVADCSEDPGGIFVSLWSETSGSVLDGYGDLDVLNDPFGRIVGSAFDDIIIGGAPDEDPLALPNTMANHFSGMGGDDIILGLGGRTTSLPVVRVMTS